MLKTVRRYREEYFWFFNVYARLQPSEGSDESRRDLADRANLHIMDW